MAWQQLLSYDVTRDCQIHPPEYPLLKQSDGEPSEEQLIWSGGGGGVGYDRSVTTSHRFEIDAELIVESEIAVEFGLDVVEFIEAGAKAVVRSKLTIGGYVAGSIGHTNTTHYTLSDDDPNDLYHTSIYEDATFGTPVFISNAGTATMCPWESPFTFKNEGIDLDNASDIWNACVCNSPVSSININYKLRFEGLQQATGSDFEVLAPPELNTCGATVLFNGQPGPLSVHVDNTAPFLIAVAITPNASCPVNELVIRARSSCDGQIFEDDNLQISVNSACCTDAPTIIDPIEPSDDERLSCPISIAAQTNHHNFDGLRFQGRQEGGNLFSIGIDTDPDGSGPYIYQSVWSCAGMPNGYYYLIVRPENDGVIDYELSDSVRIRMDATCPTVVTNVPADEGTYVGTIQVEFSETMDDLTINCSSFKVVDLNTATEIPCDVITLSDRIATFHPHVPLITDHEYEGSVEIATADIAGNPLCQRHTWQFTYPSSEGPCLTWPGVTFPGFENDGLSPESGSGSTQFIFRVKYRDPQGIAPAAGFPQVIISDGVSQIPHQMSAINSDPFTTGRVYEYRGTLNAGTYTYQFWADNLDGVPATCEGSLEHPGPVVNTPGEYLWVSCENANGPWDGSQGHPFQRIQDAIDASIPGDTVMVMACTYSEHLYIDRGVTLLAVENEPSDRPQIQGVANRRVVSVLNSPDTVRIVGFEIRGGNPLNDPDWDIDAGGGILVVNSPIVIEDCDISNNITPYQVSGCTGGGVHIRDGSYYRLTNNRIHFNRADAGGGICLVNPGPGELVGNVIDSNLARRMGAGVFLIFDSFDAGNISTIRNNTIARNDGSRQGSGLDVRFADLTLSNNIIAFNASTAASPCAGLWVAGTGSQLVSTCNDVYGNTGCGRQFYVEPAGYPGTGDFSLDPQFCDTGENPYSLKPISPCTPANNPSCGLVGALDNRGCGGSVNLVSIVLEGPSSVQESSGAQYRCRGHYDDGSDQLVDSCLVTWSCTCENGTVGNCGYFTAGEVDGAGESCQIGASYEGRSAVLPISIKNKSDQVDTLKVSIVRCSEVSDGVVSLEVSIVNATPISAFSSGFGWEPDNLELDSAIWSGDIISIFDFRFNFYKNERDSSNTHNLFQCSGISLDGSLPPGSHVVATYWFHVTSPLCTTVPVVIDSNQFVEWNFVDAGTYEDNPPAYSGAEFPPCHCCDGTVGDVNSNGEVTLGDIMLLIDAEFIRYECSLLPCMQEADVDQSGGCCPDCNDITLRDIMIPIDYLFILRITELPSCLQCE